MEPGEIAAIGITNQRETTILWDKGHRPARSATPSCGSAAAPPPFRAQTARRAGLRGSTSGPDHRPGAPMPISPPPRSEWMLGSMWKARSERARRGENSSSARWTPGCMWKLTGGAVHVTDVHQRLPHHALRHPYAVTGTRTPCCAALDIPMGHACPRCAIPARCTATARHRPGREIPIAGIGRRPAGRPVRPDMLLRPAMPRIPTAPAASC